MELSFNEKTIPSCFFSIAIFYHLIGATAENNIYSIIYFVWFALILATLISFVNCDIVQKKIKAAFQGKVVFIEHFRTMLQINTKTSGTAQFISQILEKLW